MIVFTIINNAIVGLRNEENNYELGENEYAAHINGTELSLDFGPEVTLTHIGNPDEKAVKGFYQNNTPEDNDFLLSDDATAQMGSIKSIRLPSSLTTIKNEFFKYFSNLESVIFSEQSHVETIGPWAFAECSNLRELIIPPNVGGKEITIHVDAFVQCGNLRVLDIPENSKTFLYEDTPFIGCDNLKVQNIRGKAVKYISHNATFRLPDGELASYTKRLSDIEIFGLGGDSSYLKDYTELDENIFHNVDSLEEIAIPKGVTHIQEGMGVWAGREIKRIHLPNTLTTIGEGAFAGLEKLESVHIPNSVKQILYAAFYDCKSLTRINIPNSVTFIGHGVFDGCFSLKALTIPDSVTSMGNTPFAGSTGLEQINVDQNNPKYCSKDGILYTKNMEQLLTYPAAKRAQENSFVIPNGVTAIGDGAFYKVHSLEHISIPDGVKTIGEYAFAECDGLSAMDIPQSVTDIGEGAFWECSKMKSCNLSDGITRIVEETFNGCTSLTGIHIPDGVTKIGYGAFQDCQQLESILIPDGVTTIESNAFCGCDKLKKLTIPESATYIGEKAFTDCLAIEEVVCPNRMGTRIQIMKALDERVVRDTITWIDIEGVKKAQAIAEQKQNKESDIIGDIQVLTTEANPSDVSKARAQLEQNLDKEHNKDTSNTNPQII